MDGMSSGYQTLAAEACAESGLVARIAGGDRSAETELVQRFERGVRALIRRHCRSGDPVVDDLVQDVLTDVIEQLRAGGIRDGAALPAYIRSTAVYATTAEYRRRRPMQSVDALENLAGGENPHTHVDVAQRAALLRRLLEEMPIARDREILSRFYLVEQDKDAVCRDLDIDPSHFHRVVFRARERFRALIEQFGIGAVL